MISWEADEQTHIGVKPGIELHGVMGLLRMSG